MLVDMGVKMESQLTDKRNKRKQHGFHVAEFLHKKQII